MTPLFLFCRRLGFSDNLRFRSQGSWSVHPSGSRVGTGKEVIIVFFVVRDRNKTYVSHHEKEFRRKSVPMGKYLRGCRYQGRTQGRRYKDVKSELYRDLMQFVGPNLQERHVRPHTYRRESCPVFEGFSLPYGGAGKGSEGSSWLVHSPRPRVRYYPS